MKYSLTNRDLKVEFDTFGGQITSIRDENGVEYLWQADARYWGGQAPVLFPIVGSLRNKKAVVGKSKTCCMERHGVVRKLEFSMTEQTENSVTFTICSDDRTKERFPYDFRLDIKYILSGRKLTTQYTVTNPSDEVLPFQIGGHPAFNCPINENESFEDYVVEFEHEETADCPAPVPATGLLDVENRTRVLDHSAVLKLNHGLFKVDALIFDRLKSRKARLYNPKTGYGVAMDFSDFKNLLVWSSSNGGPFVALEPWSGLSTCSDEDDIFEHKRGVFLLAGGQDKTLAFTVTVLNGSGGQKQVR
ncbi:MAG TPA: aldose 1-epimerase family protein [Caproiciproducens sp.]|nr:aldose 1-epimerase family protein [Caproiciproducens sp.]